MAITECHEIWKKRRSSKSLQDGISGTRFFQVISDDKDELESAVYDAVGINLGDLFPGTIISQCVEIAADRIDDSRLVWEVTLTYKSILSQLEQDRISVPNPLDRETKWVWTSRTVMRAVTRMQKAQYTPGIGSMNPVFAYTTWDPTTFSFDGKPYAVCNAATDPFDPALEIPITEWIASFTKNLTAVPVWVGSYNNAVNNADVTIDGLVFPTGCVKLEGLRIGEKMKENGTAYRQLTGNMIIRNYRPLRTGETVAPDPWDEEVLNEGMRQPDSVNGWKNIPTGTGSNAESVSKPVPLSAGGSPIDPSGAPIRESLLTWILFRPFTRKDFSALPI